MSEQIFVYGMHAPLAKRVKIGRSQSPQDRVAGLQTGSPEVLSLFWAQEQCDVIGEVSLHRIFSDRRAHGEWFDISPEELLSAIAERERLGALLSLPAKLFARMIKLTHRERSSDAILRLLRLPDVWFACAVNGVDRVRRKRHRQRGHLKMMNEACDKIKSKPLPISVPEDWAAAYAAQAKKCGLTLSQWVGEQCNIALPPKVAAKLSERQSQGRPRKQA